MTDFNQEINFLFLIIRQQLRISVHPGAVWQFEKISPTASFYTRSNSRFTDRIVIERRYFGLSSCQELYLFGITEMPVIEFAVAGITFIFPDLAVLIRIIAKKLARINRFVITSDTKSIVFYVLRNTISSVNLATSNAGIQAVTNSPANNPIANLFTLNYTDFHRSLFNNAELEVNCKRSNT